MSEKTTDWHPCARCGSPVMVGSYCGGGCQAARAKRQRRPSHWNVLAHVAAAASGVFLRGRERQLAFTMTFDGLLEVPVSYGPPVDDGWTHFVVTESGKFALAEHAAVQK